MLILTVHRQLNEFKAYSGHNRTKGSDLEGLPVIVDYCDMVGSYWFQFNQFSMRIIFSSSIMKVNPFQFSVLYLIKIKISFTFYCKWVSAIFLQPSLCCPAVSGDGLNLYSWLRVSETRWESAPLSQVDLWQASPPSLSLWQDLHCLSRFHYLNNSCCAQLRCLKYIIIAPTVPKITDLTN